MSALATRMEATWPAAETIALGPMVLRRGLGGGQRVSAASLRGPWQEPDISAAEATMRTMGQEPLFLLTPGDARLDQALASRGYRVKDPVVIYRCSSAALAAGGPEQMSTFAHWPPMAIARALWQEGDIGPTRLAVMDRVTGPKTAILGRAGDRASGAAFVAASGDLAVVHALYVTPSLRRRKSAQNILRAAALWAQDHGAPQIALTVTAANSAARALYASMGMEVVGSYHYRQFPD